MILNEAYHITTHSHNHFEKASVTYLKQKKIELKTMENVNDNNQLTNYRQKWIWISKF